MSWICAFCGCSNQESEETCGYCDMNPKQAPKWIPCKKRFPPTVLQVLAYGPGMVLRTCGQSLRQFRAGGKN